jgi:hypothetical protein
MEEIGYFMKLSDSQCTSLDADQLFNKQAVTQIFIKIRGSRCRASRCFLDNGDVIAVVEHHPQYMFKSPNVYRMRVKQTDQIKTVTMVDNIKEFYEYSLRQYQSKIKGELRLAVAAYRTVNAERLRAMQTACLSQQAKVSHLFRGDSKFTRVKLGSGMAAVFGKLREHRQANRVLRRAEKEQLRLQRIEIMACLAQMTRLKI